MQFTSLLRLLAGASALFCLLSPASAEVPEIRLARQYSMGYLQLNVMEHEKLIEKHAKALGIPEVKVSWFTFNGPTAVNEALISGNIDVGSGGVPGLLTLWARSKGTPQEVRGISAEGVQLAAEQRLGARVCLAAREFGLLTRPIGNAVILLLPLCVTPEEICSACAAIGHALERF